MSHSKNKASYWALSNEEIIDYLKSSEKGLTNVEVKNRLVKYGFNEIIGKERRHGSDIFLSQFKNPLVIVLIVAAIISHFLAEEINALVILSIVVLNSLLGFYQEYKAERALRELKKYVTFKANVIRDGREVEVDTRDIVPGDIIHLSIGDLVPADTRLFKVNELTTDEAPLTGESMPVVKTIEPVNKDYSLPQQLKNIAFMGTSIASGTGKGIVIATGKDTFFGKTAVYLKRKEPETDFQKNIKNFGNFLLKIIIAMTIFIFIANTILGKGILTSFLFAIALAVGITPEVLPIIMTITLSKGALEMAKEKVITKRLLSVEDFGNIDTLCCDKTGTLTEGFPSLQNYLDPNGKKDEKLLLYGLLCNSIRGRKGGKISGNPLDRAIWQSKEASRLESDLRDYSIIDENEFDFERRRMSVLIKGDRSNILVVKGATESVIEVSKSIMVNGVKTEISDELTLKLHDKIIGYEDDGYRVIAIAEKHTEKEEITKNDETELVLLGFLLFLDPPKKTVKGSLHILNKLGVNVKVISGDSPTVTRKICNEVGLRIVEDKIISGDDLERLDDKEFEKYSETYNVFARVTPEQKYRIVAGLNKEGHIVGFLGDGINDAPALKAADVGISVDSATGIAKEAADIILLKKSLRVLAHGIMQGRRTFSNIAKYILNTISANYGNMFTVAAASLFLKFIPLLPRQILLNNFISDVPLLTISTDNVDEEVLRRPRKWNMKLISRFMTYFGLISTSFDLALIIPLIFLIRASPSLFRTAWFVESVLSELVITFTIRTRLPFYKSNPSRSLMITSLLAGIIVLTITYTAFGGLLFNFVKMPIIVICLIAVILFSYFMTAEVAKRYFFKKFGM